MTKETDQQNHQTEDLVKNEQEKILVLAENIVEMLKKQCIDGSALYRDSVSKHQGAKKLLDALKAYVKYGSSQSQ